MQDLSALKFVRRLRTIASPWWIIDQCEPQSTATGRERNSTLIRQHLIQAPLTGSQRGCRTDSMLLLLGSQPSATSWNILKSC